MCILKAGLQKSVSAKTEIFVILLITLLYYEDFDYICAKNPKHILFTNHT